MPWLDRPTCIRRAELRAASQGEVGSADPWVPQPGTSLLAVWVAGSRSGRGRPGRASAGGGNPTSREMLPEGYLRRLGGAPSENK
jgi:hypothetical protein